MLRLAGVGRARGLVIVLALGLSWRGAIGGRSSLLAAGGLPLVGAGGGSGVGLVAGPPP